jgi:hypothetical protein
MKKSEMKVIIETLIPRVESQERFIKHLRKLLAKAEDNYQLSQANTSFAKGQLVNIQAREADYKLRLEQMTARYEGLLAEIEDAQ